MNTTAQVLDESRFAQTDSAFSIVPTEITIVATTLVRAALRRDMFHVRQRVSIPPEAADAPVLDAPCSRQFITTIRCLFAYACCGRRIRHGD